ncbi:MAG TPA: hypothetical protein VFT13_01865, partial [Candidatus Krumholzibacteria bacterium]|nr:hypothetical protein [Candidatus Krumholzibacteria bacterium]
MRLVLGAASLLILTRPVTASACTCADIEPGRRLENSAAVFCGRLLSMETRTVRISTSPGGKKQPVPTITYTFRVMASWKGAEEDSIRILVLRGICEPRYLPNAD